MRHLILLLSLLLVACASAPLAPPKQDQLGKQFIAPPDGLARVYVVRPGSMGGKELVQVHLDGRLKASLATKTYAAFDVEPGPHTIAAVASAIHRVVDLDATAGETYFIRFTNNGRFEVEPPASGRTAVSSSMRVAELR